MANDVVAAIATPPGMGGIGVVRVSGPSLAHLLGQLTRKTISPRVATVARFFGADGIVIDEGIALFFPAPSSYTGEDVVEIQAHGGRTVMQLLLQRCIELGARLAEPGEFTRRAYLNDKLDLAQAEAIADLIGASSAQAARSAARSLRGEFSNEINSIVAALIEIRLQVEASIDFPEEDVSVATLEKTHEAVYGVRERLKRVLAACRQGSLLREGLHVVIAGAPNVGKSSWLNRFAQQEVAIVTEVPGTTRDLIRHPVLVHGVALHFVDTAGLRATNDPVEERGVSRARSEIGAADVVLWVADTTRPETAFERSEVIGLLPDILVVQAWNKADLAGMPPGAPGWPVSALSGAGMDKLENALLAAAGWVPDEDVYLARARHLEALNRAENHCTTAMGSGGAYELMAEELRLAQQGLASITGAYTSDDLLGAIFASFCIGK